MDAMANLIKKGKEVICVTGNPIQQPRRKSLSRQVMDLAVPKIRSVRDQVYDGIKSMIVSGQIPQGTKLQESELAELFQVSRTPVREALKTLKDDGLLESGFLSRF